MAENAHSAYVKVGLEICSERFSLVGVGNFLNTLTPTKTERLQPTESKSAALIKISIKQCKCHKMPHSRSGDCNLY